MVAKAAILAGLVLSSVSAAAFVEPEMEIPSPGEVKPTGWLPVPEAGAGVSDDEMKAVYEEVKTPYKVGIVLQPEDGEMLDNPCVFRHGGKWRMFYIRYDGTGYETCLAESDDLLHWTKRGPVLPRGEAGAWDAAQADGWPTLFDTRWGGSAEISRWSGRYWMMYLGGNRTGYETDPLSTGVAFASDPLGPWTRCRENPVLSPSDPDARPFERKTIYRHFTVVDPARAHGGRFVSFYNAKQEGVWRETIGMAVSDDLRHWRRLGKGPVVSHGADDRFAISGDPMIQRIGDIWVMFHFGVGWGSGEKNAFDTFACSRDLVRWRPWTGAPLVAPSEPWDREHAHKPWVIRHDGVTYHFYCAVGEKGRALALAVSRPPAEPAVRTITDDGGRYCGWPTVTRLRSGEIVATYSGGRDGHICPWGKVRAVRSKDGGETWTKPETLVDGPLDDRDAALLELDNGDLVLFYFTSVAFALDEGFRKTREYKTHPEYARRFAELPADLVRSELGSFSMRSTDGGRTWERKVRLPASAPHGGIQLKDGRLIVVGNQYAAVRGRLPSDPEERGLGDVLAVAESTDRGRSWRELSRIPYGEADRKWTSEPHLIEGLDGTLRCYVRFPGYFWYTESRDGGKTWTALAKTGIYGKDNPAHLLRLRDGRVLLSFGRRAYTDAERKAGWRIGAYAAVSAGDAKPDSWDLDHIVTLLRTENNDMAYPSTVELDDGGFLSVYYYHPDGNPNAVLGATRWHLPKEGDSARKFDGKTVWD